MRTALLLLAMLAAPAFADGTIWKWVDEKGVTHYSDRPVPGATKVEISSGSRWDSASPRATSTSPTPQRPDASAPPYTTLEIAAPQPEQSIINTGGQLTVSINIDPRLQANHRLSLLLDGAQVEGFPPDTRNYDLKDVPRGAHTAVAVVTDNQGTTLQQSRGLTFYVRQTSGQPPVGPTLRPPPKPRR